MMLLTFEGWCMLQCQQTVPLHPPLDFPFSLLPALAEGYFSDLEVAGGKEPSSGDVSCFGEKEVGFGFFIRIFISSPQIPITRIID
jgi:hypothetical protein